MSGREVVQQVTSCSALHRAFRLGQDTGWGFALGSCLVQPFPRGGEGQRLKLEVRPAGNVVSLCPSVLWNGDVTQMLNCQHDKSMQNSCWWGWCWLLPCPSACLAHRTAAMAGRTGTRRAVRNLSGPFIGHSQIFVVILLLPS